MTSNLDSTRNMAYVPFLRDSFSLSRHHDQDAPLGQDHQTHDPLWYEYLEANLLQVD